MSFVTTFSVRSATESGAIYPPVVAHTGESTEERSNEADDDYADGHDNSAGGQRALVQREPREAIELTQYVEASSGQHAGSCDHDCDDHGPQPNAQALLQAVEARHPTSHVAGGQVRHEDDRKQHN